MRNSRRAGKPAGRKPEKQGLTGLFTKGKNIPTTAQQTLPYAALLVTVFSIARRALWREAALPHPNYEENYESAIRSVFVGGVGWISPQDVKKQRQLPLVLSYRVDGMSKDGAYLSLELEPWEYDLLLEQTKNHYKNKEKRNTK